MKRNTVVLFVMALLSWWVLLPAACGFSQESPVPVIVIDEEPEFPDEKAEGRIDRIAAREIVIDDSLYTYSSQTRFLTYGGEEVSLGFFTKGDKVIYMVDENGKLVLLQKR